jgi:hypothetical protein
LPNPLLSLPQYTHVSNSTPPAVPIPMKPDPLRYKHEADAALERAADRLRAALKESVQQLDPFPPFPGAFFSYGIEVDAPGAESPERGCVVLGPDGELYEFEISQALPDFELEIADPVSLRNEELKPIELHPRDYVVYAYEALTRVVELLLEREHDQT